jgi:hypothetical protein
MPFLLIPNEVTNQEALVWLGIANENADLNSTVLRCNGAPLPLHQWTAYTTQSGKNTLHYQSLRVRNLEPRTEYFFEFFESNQLRASARATTLPQDLPPLTEKPFTVLLGSCFCSRQSESVSLGSTYLNLQNQQKTDLKILCGDQVYLDDPALHFTWHRHSFAELEDKLFTNYVSTWNQMGWSQGFRGGYQQFLQEGANFFSSDDHEFWNNAPGWATLILDTWTQNGRDNWWQIADSLLKIFQSGSSVTRINVGTLSFFVADTRVSRDVNRRKFMSDQDLNALDEWVTNLQGVGVLVIGQPLFSKKAGFKGRFTDLNLPDYEQYEELVGILFKTNHSLLVLTGDVHYGRIAHCQLKQGVYLYEIISSPTALVNPAVGGDWNPAPDYFPAFAIARAGVSQRIVTTRSDYQFTENHFLTLSFYKDGADTRVIINRIKIEGSGQLPAPVKIADLSLR